MAFDNAFDMLIPGGIDTNARVRHIDSTALIPPVRSLQWVLSYIVVEDIAAANNNARPYHTHTNYGVDGEILSRFWIAWRISGRCSRTSGKLIPLSCSYSG